MPTLGLATWSSSKTLAPLASPRGEHLHPEVIHLQPKLRAMEAEIFQRDDGELLLLAEN
jgi:hypothetical protein